MTTKVGSGSTPRGGEAAYKSTGTPLIRSMNVHFGGFREDGLAHIDDDQAAALRNVEVRARDVLLNITGASIGRVTIAPPHMDGARVNQHVCIIRPDDRLEPSFLRWFLASPHQQRLINSMESGATRQALTKEKILAFEVPLPSLDGQREIVAELEKQFSRLDEAVANLQRVKANLKRYKDSVYSEAFSKGPNSTLGELIEAGPQNGLYLPKDLYGDGVPILRIDDYQTAWIRPVQELRRVKATKEQISTWALCEDDLVVNRVNSMTHLGKCVRIPKSLAGTVFESNMMRMRLTTAASPKYVEHYLASRLGKKRLTGNAKWAVNQASINQKDVRATPIFVPDLATQLALVTEIDRQLSIVREVEAEVDTNLHRAQSLRQATLAKAFSIP
nr:restriction endonuclease subunit S [Rhodoferax sp.]